MLSNNFTLDNFFDAVPLHTATEPSSERYFAPEQPSTLIVSEALPLTATKDVSHGTPQAAQEDDVSEGGFLPPPPPVPLNAFPHIISTLLQETADAFGVPLEIPVACILAYLSCLVGRSKVISVKESWKEAGNLWIALVANSGTGKTPCMQAMLDPIHKREDAAKKAYDTALIAYQQALKEYKAAQKKNDTVQCMQPQEPRWRQTIANDCTPEALGSMLCGNPKGIHWQADELVSLTDNRYVRSAKPLLLSGHASASLKTTRTGNPKRNFFIRNACIGIFGGIQTGILAKAFQGGVGGIDEESGLLPRFLFVRAVVTQPAYFTEHTLSSQSAQLLERIAAHLWQWDIEYDGDGNEVERRIQVTDEARALYVPWYNSIASEAYISTYSAMLKKAQAHALRIALLLHCLDAALAGTDGMTPVTEDTMRRALLLADWFLEHQKQCWMILTPSGRTKQANPLEIAIMQAVVEHADAITANGGITSAALLDAVKKKAGMSRVTSKLLANAATALKLECCKLNGNRARTVTQEQIEIFRTTVRSVQHVLSHAVAKNSGQDSSNKEPSAGELAA